MPNYSGAAAPLLPVGTALSQAFTQPVQEPSRGFPTLSVRHGLTWDTLTYHSRIWGERSVGFYFDFAGLPEKFQEDGDSLAGGK